MSGLKTLYVSDLDGTLLRSNETTSDYTNEVINRLTVQGMIFSYATAVIRENDEDGIARWLEENWKA